MRGRFDCWTESPFDCSTERNAHHTEAEETEVAVDSKSFDMEMGDFVTSHGCCSVCLGC